MGNNKTTIEFNGRKYNALTGEIVHQSDSKSSVIQPTIRSNTPATNPVHQSGKVIDGFSRTSLTAHPAKQSPVNAPPSHHSHHTTKKTHHRTVAGQAVRHAPERSKTLMRTAVAKPTISKAKAIGSKAAGLTSSHQTDHHSHRETPRHPINPARIERARTTSKSGLISKFGSSSSAAGVTKKTAPLAVRPAPAHAPPSTTLTVPRTSTHPAAHRTASHSKSTAAFHHALQGATAHEQPSPKHTRAHGRTARKLGISNRAMTTVTSALAVVLLAGFFAYQNMPNLSLRMAASRAGFSATMPGYRPSGFAMQGPIKYGPGEVIISFKSNSDNRAYQVTQRPSKWNSETLLENFVASDKKPYQTFQKQGKTIYIYNDSDATWVNGGVWYQVAGNSSLTSDQLLNIASSL